MEKVRKVLYKGSEILIVDCWDAKGEQMVAVFNQAKSLAFMHGLQQYHTRKHPQSLRLQSN